MNWRIRGLTILERCLFGAGLILIAVFGVAMAYRSIASRSALRDFDRAMAAPEKEGLTGAAGLDGDRNIDFSLWSEKRIRAYRDSLSALKAAPMAVIRLEKIDVRAPVFEGTDELVLNRGVGWIAGTARPGEQGNIGIAGHRDGFFRKLKDVLPGDAIELGTTQGKAVYTVDQIEIVTPDDVSVLRPRETPSLTLVTCYPFYFVGDAPQRFIVHASLKERAGK